MAKRIRFFVLATAVALMAGITPAKNVWAKAAANGGEAVQIVFTSGVIITVPLDKVDEIDQIITDYMSTGGDIFSVEYIYDDYLPGSSEVRFNYVPILPVNGHMPNDGVTLQYWMDNHQFSLTPGPGSRK